MLTVLRESSPFTAYSTWPATRANSVWSRPMPTLAPGCTRSEERRVGKECRSRCDWSSDVCSSDLGLARVLAFYRIQHLAGDAREQRVVAPHADVGAGMHLRAALAHQDLPGIDALAAERLDAEALGLGIAPVARAAACLLVGHALPLHDIVDADLGVGLPMALRFLVVLAPAQHYQKTQGH